MGQVDRGEYRELEEITLKEYSKRWLIYIKSQVKPRTHGFYEYINRVHLVPYFGNYRLTSIRPDMIELYLSKKLETKLSNKTIRHHLVTLKAMLNQAVVLGYLKNNPGQHVKGPRVEHKEMDFLKPGEIRLLLEKASPEYHALFLTAIMTGMRHEARGAVSS